MDESIGVREPEKRAHLIYFTDPICSSCWGLEPQLRRLKLAYGKSLQIEYRMGGLLPDWSYNSGGISKPSDVAHHWDEVSLHYDMPIDGDIWLEDPLESSYPPSIAFKAAQLQGEEKAQAFLRKLREMLFLQKRNINRWEHTAVAALAVGLDTLRLKADIAGVGKELFAQDLQLARQMGVRGFPTIFFEDSTGRREMLYGARPYEMYEQVLTRLYPDLPRQGSTRGVQALWQHFPTLTAREYAELGGMNREEAEAQLEGLVRMNILDKWPTKNGALYWKR